MAATACNSRKLTSPRPPRTAGTATEVPGQLEPRATRAHAIPSPCCFPLALAASGGPFLGAGSSAN